MDRVLGLCDQAVDLVARIEPTVANADGLRAGIRGLQALIDRLTVMQAKWIAEADARKVWQGSGARDIADWLANTTKSSYGNAKRKAKLGAALGSSPALDDAVAQGHLSPDAAEALHDAVTNPPDGADVAELVDACKGATPREAGDAARAWKRIHSEESEEQAAHRRHQQRSVRFGAVDDGMIDTLVRLPERETAELRATITAIAGKPCEHDGRTTEQRLADGLVQLCAAYAKGDVRGGREGANLVITITAEAYAGLTDEPAVAATGQHIPAHVARQIAENATLQRVVTQGSRILDLGRTVRFASHDQYTALVARDGGCRWPGCHIPAAWCDIDHLVAFEQGGATDLENLAMWCRHHHIRKHQPGTRIHGDAQHLRVELADGTVFACPPKRPRIQAAA